MTPTNRSPRVTCPCDTVLLPDAALTPESLTTDSLEDQISLLWAT